MTTIPDLICPVRPGDDNEELRYAMRTWCRNLPHNQLWIIGHLPDWINPTTVRHIPGNFEDFGPVNVYRNIQLAVSHPDMPDHAVIVNDDMFVTEPVQQVPVMYRSSLDDHINIPGVQRQARKPGRKAWWPQSLESTRAALQASGTPDPISYELHVPFPVHVPSMRSVLTEFQHVTPDNPPQWRTLYGNRCHAGGTQVEDCKRWDEGPVERPYHSTNDGSFRHFHLWFQVNFPAPCRYERELPCRPHRPCQPRQPSSGDPSSDDPSSGDPDSDSHPGSTSTSEPGTPTPPTKPEGPDMNQFIATLKSIFTEKTRLAIYGVFVALFALLVVYHLVDPAAVPAWLGLVGSILGVAGNATAAVSLASQIKTGLFSDDSKPADG